MDLIRQMKWQFLLLHRNRIITISIAVTVIYALIFFGVNHLGASDKILTLIIFNDPAIIGLLFMEVVILLEKRQNVLSALFVTPTSIHHYLLARVLPLSIIGWLASLGMAFAALGSNFNILHFSMGSFGVSLIACLTGIWLASKSDEFMLVILKSIPILIIFFNLPLLNYFEVTDFWLFNLMPVQGGLSLIAHSYQTVSSVPGLLFGYLSLTAWIILAYWISYNAFLKHVIRR